MDIMHWLFHWAEMENSHRREQRGLRTAGLSERKLRAMAPDERVEALERAKLDPYDYIYLAY